MNKMYLQNFDRGSAKTTKKIVNSGQVPNTYKYLHKVPNLFKNVDIKKKTDYTIQQGMNV